MEYEIRSRRVGKAKFNKIAFLEILYYKKGNLS